jgi:hypothetical protein
LLWSAARRAARGTGFFLMALDLDDISRVMIVVRSQRSVRSSARDLCESTSDRVNRWSLPLCAGGPGRPLHNAISTSGSINEAGWRFQSFRINDLELVDQTGGSWNHLVRWLRLLAAIDGHPGSE